MKRILSIFASVATLCATAQTSSGEDEDFFELERWCAGAGAALMLPQGGSDAHRRAGGEARFGYYLDEFTLLEASISRLENVSGVSCDVLWHWWGYEKFDPFFTFGANGWIEGEVGPSAGWGCFWHFSDKWSFRFDADATLGIDGETEMVYKLGAAVQYAF